jgi:hypothetical protein
MTYPRHKPVCHRVCHILSHNIYIWLNWVKCSATCCVSVVSVSVATLRSAKTTRDPYYAQLPCILCSILYQACLGGGFLNLRASCINFYEKSIYNSRLTHELNYRNALHKNGRVSCITPLPLTWVMCFLLFIITLWYISCHERVASPQPAKPPERGGCGLKDYPRLLYNLGNAKRPHPPQANKKQNKSLTSGLGPHLTPFTSWNHHFHQSPPSYMNLYMNPIKIAWRMNWGLSAWCMNWGLSNTPVL